MGTGPIGNGTKWKRDRLGTGPIGNGTDWEQAPLALVSARSADEHEPSARQVESKCATSAPTFAPGLRPHRHRDCPHAVAGHPHAHGPHACAERGGKPPLRPPPIRRCTNVGDARSPAVAAATHRRRPHSVIESTSATPLWDRDASADGERHAKVPTACARPGQPGVALRMPHLRRGWARPCHICTGTGLTPPTSALGLGSPRPHLHRGWAHPYPRLHRI